MATAAEGLSRGGALNADLSSRQKAFYIQSYQAQKKVVAVVPKKVPTLIEVLHKRSRYLGNIPVSVNAIKKRLQYA